MSLANSTESCPVQASPFQPGAVLDAVEEEILIKDKLLSVRPY